MSDTFSIACTQCREHLWIAQGWPRKDAPTNACHVYTADGHGQAMTDFFFRRLGHPLIFGNNCDYPILDYKEVGPKADEEEGGDSLAVADEPAP